MVGLIVACGIACWCLVVLVTATPEDEKDFIEACKRWRGGRLL